MLGLTWDDIDIDAGELSIGRQLQRVSQQLLHRETKTTTSDATLPLPEVCAAALRFRKVEEAHARDVAGSAWQGGKMIFTTTWGTPIEPRNINWPAGSAAPLRASREVGSDGSWLRAGQGSEAGEDQQSPRGA